MFPPERIICLTEETVETLYLLGEDSRIVDPMEYRGIRYTIRKRIERDEWYVAIHPDGVELRGKVIAGSRGEADLEAHSMINDWVGRHPHEHHQQ